MTKNLPIGKTIAKPVTNVVIVFCGQSYKHFTIVIYDPRVVIWSIFLSGTTLES